MKITVLGKGHFEGHSKRTGNDYNFNQVHFLGLANGIEGQACLTQALDPVAVPYESIEIGKTYNIEYDGKGRVIAFERCKD